MKKLTELWSEHHGRMQAQGCLPDDRRDLLLLEGTFYAGAVMLFHELTKDIEATGRRLEELAHELGVDTRVMRGRVQ